MPEEAFKTFTSDRGKEFSCWEEVEKMGIDFYFADPYCSWQRECNKNSNREDRYIKSGDRRLDKCINADKLKTKKMFKLCNAI